MSHQFKVVRIERWFLYHGRLYGEVYGHPNCDSGEFVAISPILEQSGNYVRTKNNVYVLGNEHKGFKDEN
jgi:hypothetical protein